MQSLKKGYNLYLEDTSGGTLPLGVEIISSLIDKFAAATSCTTRLIVSPLCCQRSCEERLLLPQSTNREENQKLLPRTNMQGWLQQYFNFSFKRIKVSLSILASSWNGVSLIDLTNFTYFGLSARKFLRTDSKGQYISKKIDYSLFSFVF